MFFFYNSRGMKLRLALLCMAAALLMSCEPYNRSNSGVSAIDKTILYDFRTPRAPAPPKLDAATERAVLAAVAPRYLEARQCPPARAGQAQPPVLWITAAAEGAFTAPGVKQNVYLVRRLACGEDSGPNHLVVWADGKAAANVETPDSTILKTYDLNGDGENELLLADWSARNNSTAVLARLAQFDQNSLPAVENFGIVYDNTCASASDPAMDAVVLWYLPRPGQKMPSFTAQRFRAHCPAQGQPPQWVEITR
jgi:hypothetical protein